METMGRDEPSLDPMEGPHAAGPTTASGRRRSWLAENQVASWGGIAAVAIAAVVLSILLDNKIADTIG